MLLSAVVLGVDHELDLFGDRSVDVEPEAVEQERVGGVARPRDRCARRRSGRRRRCVTGGSGASCARSGVTISSAKKSDARKATVPRRAVADGALQTHSLSMVRPFEEREARLVDPGIACSAREHGRVAESECKQDSRWPAAGSEDLLAFSRERLGLTDNYVVWPPTGQTRLSVVSRPAGSWPWRGLAAGRKSRATCTQFFGPVRGGRRKRKWRRLTAAKNVAIADSTDKTVHQALGQAPESRAGVWRL